MFEKINKWNLNIYIYIYSIILTFALVQRGYNTAVKYKQKFQRLYRELTKDLLRKNTRV